MSPFAVLMHVFNTVLFVHCCRELPHRSLNVASYLRPELSLQLSVKQQVHIEHLGNNNPQVLL